VSTAEKLELINNLLLFAGDRALKALRVLNPAYSLQHLMELTGIIRPCGDGLSSHADANLWDRFSFARTALLSEPRFADALAAWESRPPEDRQAFTVVVWMTEVVGVEGERELAVPLKAFARHMAAGGVDLGLPVDYCFSHYAGSDTWHRVSVRPDPDSGLFQISLAGWKPLQRVRRILRRGLECRQVC
jgi:hypothetical protein